MVRWGEACSGMASRGSRVWLWQGLVRQVPANHVAASHGSHGSFRQVKAGYGPVWCVTSRQSSLVVARRIAPCHFRSRLRHSARRKSWQFWSGKSCCSSSTHGMAQQVSHGGSGLSALLKVAAWQSRWSGFGHCWLRRGMAVWAGLVLAKHGSVHQVQVRQSRLRLFRCGSSGFGLFSPRMSLQVSHGKSGPGRSSRGAAWFGKGGSHCLSRSVAASSVGSRHGRHGH